MLPLGVCTTGFGSGTGLIGGVVIVGVLTDGTLIGPTVTGGVVTDGTVVGGTVTVGAGTLTVGTLTVGTLIVGTDASEDAAATSSAPQATTAGAMRRRMSERTGHCSPPDRSAAEGLEIANRLRTGPLRSAREPLLRVHHVGRNDDCVQVPVANPHAKRVLRCVRLGGVRLRALGASVAGVTVMRPWGAGAIPGDVRCVGKGPIR